MWRYLVISAALLGGCGSAWQTTVRATAVAAIAADQVLAESYRACSQEQIEDIETNPPEEWSAFAEYCRRMQPVYEVIEQIGCAVDALKDLVLAANEILEAGEEPDQHWAGAVCGVARAIRSAWEIAEDPPDVLDTVVNLACGLANGWVVEHEPCDVGTIPGCEVAE